MEELELFALPLTRQKYTWFRDNLCSKLDRMLVIGKWLLEYLEMRLWGLKEELLIMHLYYRG